MFVDEHRMTEHAARRQNADIARELYRRCAVAIDHHQELVDALRAMHGERQVARLGRGEAVAQQVGRAGVDLRRRDDAGETA